jgi:hypothetical protein
LTALSNQRWRSLENFDTAVNLRRSKHEADQIAQVMMHSMRVHSRDRFVRRQAFEKADGFIPSTVRGVRVSDVCRASFRAFFASLHK